MGLSAKVGSFNTGTGAVGSTVVVNDVGFQPKIVFFWWNGRTGTVDASGRATHQRGFGVGVSSTDRRFMTSLSQDTPTAMLTNTTQGNAACIGLTTTGDAIDGLMDVQSMDSGGFTLVVDDVFVASYRVHYLALGGSDITNVTTGQFTGNAAGVTGNQDITTVGFQPDLVMVFGTGQTTANNTVRADSRIMMGVGHSTGSAVWAGGSNDGAGNAQAMSYCKASEFISHFNTGVTGLDDRATFTGFLSNGFHVNWTTVTIGGSVNMFVAIKGGLSVVGNLLTQTDTTTPIAESGFGFSPKAALLVSAGKAEDSANTPTDNDEWSMGAFTSTSSRVAMSMSDDDAAGTAVVGTGVSHDEVYQNLLNTSGAVEGEMDVQSVDSDGFTLIMDDADPAQAFVWYVAFGQSALTQTISGGITPSGEISKEGRKSLAGTITSSGLANKLVSKFFSGDVSSIVGTAVKQTAKTLAGNLSSIVGTLLSSRLFSSILSGGITPSGSVNKETGKTLSGTITSAGSSTKQTEKSFSGSITTSGNIIKQAIKSFGGTLSSEGSLFKTVAKLLSGALSLAGDLVGDFISGGQTFFKELSGTLTSSGDINKQTSKTFSGAITLAGDIVKQSQKAVQGSITPAGNIAKSISRFLSGILSGAGDLTTNFIGGGIAYFQNLTGTILFSGEVSKRTETQKSGSITPEGSLVKSISKSLVGILSLSGSVSKAISKFFSGLLSLAGNLATLTGIIPSANNIYLLGSRIVTERLTGSATRTVILRGIRTFTIRLIGKKE